MYAITPIVANLYMEEFEAKAIRTALNPPAVWLRYVDDTFVKIREYFVNEFTEHLNSIDENIKFITEPETEGKLPFLDSCTTLNDDGFVPAVTWPQRINLIRLMKWPWWSRKLATLQHIWLW